MNTIDDALTEYVWSEYRSLPSPSRALSILLDFIAQVAPQSVTSGSPHKRTNSPPASPSALRQMPFSKFKALVLAITPNSIVSSPAMIATYRKQCKLVKSYLKNAPQMVECQLQPILINWFADLDRTVHPMIHSPTKSQPSFVNKLVSNRKASNGSNAGDREQDWQKRREELLEWRQSYEEVYNAMEDEVRKTRAENARLKATLRQVMIALAHLQDVYGPSFDFSAAFAAAEIEPALDVVDVSGKTTATV